MSDRLGCDECGKNLIDCHSGTNENLCKICAELMGLIKNTR